MPRLFVLTSAALLALLTTAFLASPDAPQAPANAPNILVLVADDAGWDDFGAYGHPTIRTPHLDALAEGGWTADRAFLTTPQCSPSRVSMLTGQYAHTVQAEDLHVPLAPEHRFVPSFLREAGYFTGHLLKTHYGPDAEAQFDWYSPDLADFSTFLDAADDQPFFMWVGFSDPHRAYGDALNRHAPSDVRLPPTVRDTPETRADYVQYYDEIARMDTVAGSYLAELERRGLREDTYVLFLSDNGSPMPRAKGTLYDAGIKRPLLVDGPGVADGVRYDGLVSVLDLAPTFLTWAGVPVPPEMLGEDLMSRLADVSLPGHTYVFSERNWHNADEHLRSVRTDAFKLIWNNYVELPHGTAADITGSPTWQALRAARDAGTLTPAQARLFETPRPRVELYDLDNDPHELRNLAPDPAYRDTVQALMATLETWMTDTGDVPPHQRRRHDNIDRLTGVKFTLTNPPMYNHDD
ncbi:MAG: sulfatase [Bacteroidota bacterium]